MSSQSKITKHKKKQVIETIRGKKIRPNQQDWTLKNFGNRTN